MKQPIYPTELDQMIGRAEAACERYRQAATERGVSPRGLRARVARLRSMLETLARLKAEQQEQVEKNGRPKAP